MPINCCTFCNMMCLLYYSLIFITTQFLDAHVVVLNTPGGEKPNLADSSPENEDATNFSNSNENSGENSDGDHGDRDETGVSEDNDKQKRPESSLEIEDAEDFSNSNENSVGNPKEKPNNSNSDVSEDNDKQKRPESSLEIEDAEDYSNSNENSVGNPKEIPNNSNSDVSEDNSSSEYDKDRIHDDTSKDNGQNEQTGDQFGKGNTEAGMRIDKNEQNGKYNYSANQTALTWKLWESELNVGNMAQIYPINRHIYQPDEYINLNRRFVPQYPYTYVKKNKDAAQENQEIIPVEAPPEIVELVAKKTALIQSLKPNHVDDYLTEKMLRSGDYWNGVWKEDVYPKTSLRKPEQKALGTIKAQIKPGSDFYNIVAEMKKISPRLLYIINVNY